MAYMYKHGRVWRITIYRDHARKDINLGSDFVRAKVLKASIEQALQEGKFKINLTGTLYALGLTDPDFQLPLPVPKVEKVSWDDSVLRVLGHFKKLGRSPRTIELAAKALKSMENSLSPKSVDDVSAESVDLWIASLLTQKSKKDPTGNKLVSPSYAAVHIRSAKACFRWFNRWKLIPSNPFSGCEMPKVDKPLPKPFTREDFDKLLDGCNAPLKRCIQILTYSGMRPNELMNLVWGKVQLGGNPAIFIQPINKWNPKGLVERMIPCTPKLLAVLGNPGRPDERVVGINELENPINMNWLERSFRRAIKRAGLKEKGYTPYCCRDTYATTLAIDGYEAHAIAARLGHSNLQTSMHYVSLARVILDQKGSFKNTAKA